jgi:ribosomal protein S18 acetylase RimI-like enzyme
VLIRLFTPADEPAVVALWKEALPGTAPHHDPAASIRAKLADGGDLFFVAEADGEVVGTVMGGYDGHRGWLYSVAVSPAHRRRGVGTALIRHVEAALADRGCPKVNLQVLVSNAEVVAFYQSLGYAVEERISMGKRLY